MGRDPTPMNSRGPRAVPCVLGTRVRAFYVLVVDRVSLMVFVVGVAGAGSSPMAAKATQPPPGRVGRGRQEHQRAACRGPGAAASEGGRAGRARGVDRQVGGSVGFKDSAVAGETPRRVFQGGMGGTVLLIFSGSFIRLCVCVSKDRERGAIYCSKCARGCDLVARR